MGRAVLREADPRPAISLRRRASKNRILEDSIFIWVPKTAGTSLFAAFERFGAQKTLSVNAIGRQFTGRGLYTFGHMSILDLVRDGYLPSDFVQRAWKFAFVRNPYDRAVSLFRYLVKIGVLPPKTTFPIFCSYLEAGAFEDVGPYNFKGLSQLNPQSRWLFDDSGKCLCDYIGRFENIYSDFRVVQERIGRYASAVELPHENATTRAATRTYYTEREAAIVATVYSQDFDRFGYNISQL
jgi:hypothetical protein